MSTEHSSMREPHEEENDALLGPILAARNEMAHQAMRALEDGNFLTFTVARDEWLLGCFHVDAARQICDAFDAADPKQDEREK